MTWWDREMASRLPPGQTIVVPTLAYTDDFWSHLMALVQPEHDPFAPHEDDGQPDLDETYHRAVREQTPTALTEPAGRRVPSEELHELGPADGMLEESDGLEVMELTGSGEPVVFVEAGAPADGEDHDPTPQPGVGRRAKRKGAATRSPSRAKKLAEELGE